jgi:hypothetical protein
VLWQDAYVLALFGARNSLPKPQTQHSELNADIVLSQDAYVLAFSEPDELDALHGAPALEVRKHKILTHKRNLDALHGVLAAQCLALEVWIYRRAVGVRTSE